jgi:hypothetical protein
MVNLISWITPYLQPPCQGVVRTTPTTATPKKTGFRIVLGRLAAGSLLRSHHTALFCITMMLALATSSHARSPGVPPPETAMDAARIVQDWVRSWAVEGQAPKVRGAAVLLRRGGRIIAQGEAFADEATNLDRAARLAMVRAMGTDREPTGLGEGPGSNLTIEVELAGALIPLQADTDVALALAVSPGLDGVAVRLGERVAARFPSQMRPTGQNAAEGIRALISELADDPARGLDELPTLRQAGYSFYRFRTVDLVQLSPGTGFIFAHRGGRVIEPSEITSARLVRMAAGMTEYLAGRLWPGVEPYGLMGTLDPVTGRVESRFESPAGQAMAASALLRCARTTGLDDSTRALARSTAETILEQLAIVAEGEIEPWASPADAAATIVALTDAGKLIQGEELTTLFDRCAARVAPAFNPKARVFTDEVPETAWGMTTLALVRLAKAGVVSPELASSAVRSTFRNTPPERLVGQLPWLGWAEVESAAPDAPIPSAPALIEVRRLIFKHQLDTTTLGPDDRDLAGSIVFTTGTTPLPNWNTVRPLPFLADMLADPRLTSGTLTSGQASSELAHLLAGLRFLNQLSVGPVEGHAYPRPARAMWGVRMALWDQRIGIEATALGLETVCRTLTAVNELATRSTGKNKGSQTP